MKKLPIGIQSIEKILEHNEYIYVDKTAFAYQLIHEGSPHYFMARPRRFGKSLFLNTLEEIFKGNRELFKGCQIHGSDYNWQEHPLLYFDFAQILTTTPQKLEESLIRVLTQMALSYGESLEFFSSIEGLAQLVKILSKRNRVVVLVDEYDAPIINNLKNKEIAQDNRDILRGFFTSLKSLDKYLRFTFVTGVSKFSQVSLFSGPNNLKDITFDPRYAELMGYTEKEIKFFFSDYIKVIAKKRMDAKKNMSEEELLGEIRSWYNGYRFSEENSSVYNPYSTLLFLDTGKTKSYWYRTGTPSFLMEEVKKQPLALLSLSGTIATESSLSDISSLDQIDIVALMFQTGYLTIQSYNQEEESYRLDFPNHEVKQAFLHSLLQEFTEVEPLKVDRMAQQVREELESFNVAAFIKTMNTHFAKIPYHAFTRAQEGFYQAVFFTFLERSAIKSQAEVATNIGRIDLVAEIANAIYIFELKVDQTAAKAFDQAEMKKYREKYSTVEKEVVVVGINFSSDSRNIMEWQGVIFSPSGQWKAL